jgi:uncharacterized DUF497 family protein
VFFNEPLLMVPALRHSFSQQHVHALGRTDDGRLLHITFTLWGKRNDNPGDFHPGYEPEGAKLL